MDLKVPQTMPQSQTGEAPYALLRLNNQLNDCKTMI